MLIYIGHVTLRMKARLKHIIYYKFVKKKILIMPNLLTLVS